MKCPLCGRPMGRYDGRCIPCDQRRLDDAAFRAWSDPVLGIEPLPDPRVNTMGQAHAHSQPTERAAALAVWPKTGTQRMTVLQKLLEAPGGLTDIEIADATGLYLYSAAPRRTELLQGGWVEDSGKRRPTGHGGDAIVWVVTAAARTRWT